MIKHNDEKWDLHMLKIAKLCSEMSKDPSTKVGSVIKGPNKKILSTGYNGFPTYIDDRDEWYNDRDIKYKLIIHAEENALTHAQKIPPESTLYVYPLLPCHNCYEKINAAGIKRIVTVQHNPIKEKCETCGPDKLCAKERWASSWEQTIKSMEQNNCQIIYYSNSEL